MQKLIASFLVLLFLCANTSIGQLWKVPNLIEHYNEHKSEKLNDSFTFLDFVKMHYEKNSEHEQEHQDHHDLPFKSIEHYSIVLFICAATNYQVSWMKTITAFKKNFFYKKSFKSNDLTSIWLPPKIA